jgi:hypothetical protein
VIFELLCRVPWDNAPDSSTMTVPSSGESPKVHKPPTPNAEKTAPEYLKPLSLGGAQNTTSDGGASSSKDDMCPNPASRRLDESPQAPPANP